MYANMQAILEWEEMQKRGKRREEKKKSGRGEIIC